MQRTPVSRLWIGVVVLCACGAAPKTPAASQIASSSPSASASTSTSTSTSDPDRDHDGIPNECDACPDQPETANGICDEDGCPDVSVDAFPQGVITIQSVLLFDKRSSKISGVAQPLIDQIARNMVLNKDVIDLVWVVGHASKDEPDGEGTALARATAVRQALVAQGVDGAHLEARSLGVRKPFDGHEDSLNRRVEFVVARAQGREQFRLIGDAIEQVATTETTRNAPVCRPRPASCGR